jgi:hypothetical protein
MPIFSLRRSPRTPFAPDLTLSKRPLSIKKTTVHPNHSDGETNPSVHPSFNTKMQGSRPGRSTLSSRRRH